MFSGSRKRSATFAFSRPQDSERNRAGYLESFPPADVPKHKKAGKVTTSKDFKQTKLTKPSKQRTKLAPTDIDFGLRHAVGRRALRPLPNDFHAPPTRKQAPLRRALRFC